MSEIKNRKLTQEEKEVINRAVGLIDFLPLAEYDRKKFSYSPDILKDFISIIESPESELNDLISYYMTARPILKAYNKYLDYQIKTIFDEQEKEEYYSERHIVSLLWHWLDDTMYEIGQVSL